MKKIYKYRKNKSIRCQLKNCPVGLDFKEYEGINEMREKFSIKYNIDIGEHDDEFFFFKKSSSSGEYNCSVDYNNSLIKFEVSKRSIIYTTPCYYDVVDEVYGPRDSFPEFFDMHKRLNEYGEVRLIYAEKEILPFTIDIEKISDMELTNRWWMKNIYLSINFSTRLPNNVENLVLKFPKDKKRDVLFFIDDIHMLRRAIDNKFSEEILEIIYNSHSDSKESVDINNLTP